MSDYIRQTNRPRAECDALVRGYNDRCQGVKVRSNPFLPETEPFDQWEEGWLEGNWDIYHDLVDLTQPLRNI